MRHPQLSPPSQSIPELYAVFRVGEDAGRDAAGGCDSCPREGREEHHVQIFTSLFVGYPVNFEKIRTQRQI